MARRRAGPPSRHQAEAEAAETGRKVGRDLAGIVTVGKASAKLGELMSADRDAQLRAAGPAHGIPLATVTKRLRRMGRIEDRPLLLLA
jgi:hypothetical protein